MKQREIACQDIIKSNEIEIKKNVITAHCDDFWENLMKSNEQRSVAVVVVGASEKDARDATSSSEHVEQTQCSNLCCRLEAGNFPLNHS